MGSDSIFAENFVADRMKREYEKYGRPHGQAIPQYINPDQRHSIEPSYGQYDRPINEIV